MSKPLSVCLTHQIMCNFSEETSAHTFPIPLGIMLKLHEQVVKRTGGKAMMRQSFCSTLWFLSKYRYVSHLRTWDHLIPNLTAYCKTNKPGQALGIVSVITRLSVIPLDKSKLKVSLTYLNNHQQCLSSSHRVKAKATTWLPSSYQPVMKSTVFCHSPPHYSPY